MMTSYFLVLAKINEAFVDKDNRPLIDIRINHTIIIDDPFQDPEGFTGMTHYSRTMASL